MLCDQVSGQSFGIVNPNDRLLGGPGSDQIFGGSGSDVILGSLGYDEIRPGSGDNVIEDFRVADHDKIGISQVMEYSLAQIGNDLRFSTGISTTILYGIDQSSFDTVTLIFDV